MRTNGISRLSISGTSHRRRPFLNLRLRKGSVQYCDGTVDKIFGRDDDDETMTHWKMRVMRTLVEERYQASDRHKWRFLCPYADRRY
jgi:hypothetical protein